MSCTDTFASFARFANETDKQIEGMSVRLHLGVWHSTDQVPDHREELDQEGNRVCFGMGRNRVDDFARETMKSLFVNFRPWRRRKKRI